MIFDHAARVHSFEILADAARTLGASASLQAADALLV
jgi:hypothetical protein